MSGPLRFASSCTASCFLICALGRRLVAPEEKHNRHQCQSDQLSRKAHQKQFWCLLPTCTHRKLGNHTSDCGHHSKGGKAFSQPSKRLTQQERHTMFKNCCPSRAGVTCTHGPWRFPLTFLLSPSTQVKTRSFQFTNARGSPTFLRNNHSKKCLVRGQASASPQRASRTLPFGDDMIAFCTG